MSTLHISYFSNTESGIVYNEKYPEGVTYRGVELKPSLSFNYDSFQYSELYVGINYIELNGIKRIFSDEELDEIINLATDWVQALGQEGNPTLEQAKETSQNKLASDFNSAVLNISTALPHEMASWRKQEEQARAWNADNSVSTPIIDAILTTRTIGETKQQLVDLIIGNANAYEAAYGALLGKYQKLSKDIAAATTADAANMIKWA